LRQSTDDHPAIDVRLQELLVLSPHPQERVEVLDRVLDRLGPAVPDFSALMSAARGRELTDDEISNLFNEMANGVVAVHRKIADALKVPGMVMADLVPSSLSYFERFCGPAPGEGGLEEYLDFVLPAYRQEIVRCDLVRGLDVCFLGALRDDLSPCRWTENVSDDDLWDALVACRVDSSPYPLIAALDLAIARQHDERFRSFAETAVEKLTRDNFPRPDGVDIYELLPLFVELVLHWIHTLDGGATRPPFWKRLCAWTHAAVLVRLTQQLEIDIQALSNWVHTNQTTAGVYAGIFDLQAEPMYRAAELSREALRDEVLGRLFVLKARHGAEGRTVPGEAAIDEAILRRAEQGSPFGYLFPGPLEGHRRPTNVSGRSLPDDGVELIENDVAEDQLGRALSRISYLCQCYDIRESTLLKLRDALNMIAVAGDRDSRNLIAKNLTNTCLLAMAKRHTDLAHAIAVKALEMAPAASSREDAISLLRAIVLASAAFEKKDEWASWLQHQLYHLANLIPAGTASRAILDDLSEIKTVTDAKAGMCGRAEAVASAAV
jgi:hypothetical protein